MPAMRRTLFTVAAGASAVLCVAVCVLWVRSSWQNTAARDTLQKQIEGATARMVEAQAVANSRVAAGVAALRNLLSEPEAERANEARVRVDEANALSNAANAETARRMAEVNRLNAQLLATPTGGSAVYKWAAGVLLIPPLAWVIRLSWMRVRTVLRRRDGQCVECGYDLRATPGRCPECGAVPVVEGKA